MSKGVRMDVCAICGKEGPVSDPDSKPPYVQLSCVLQKSEEKVQAMKPQPQQHTIKGYTVTVETGVPVRVSLPKPENGQYVLLANYIGNFHGGTRIKHFLASPTLGYCGIRATTGRLHGSWESTDTKVIFTAETFTKENVKKQIGFGRFCPRCFQAVAIELELAKA